jgi:hypothetical protein
MVCYAVPLAAGIIHGAWRKSARKADPHGFWLTLMFLGASLFGVIDHAWNGELLLIGPNIMMDLGLGTAITAGVIGSWKLVTWRVQAPTIPIAVASGRITGIKK